MMVVLLLQDLARCLYRVHVSYIDPRSTLGTLVFHVSRGMCRCVALFQFDGTSEKRGSVAFVSTERQEAAVVTFKTEI